jgi:rare lipoprotein A
LIEFLRALFVGAILAGHPVAPEAKTVTASYYGHGEKLARHTANGEVFKPDALTAAHRSLPLGTHLKVTNGNRSVVVRVNDRGPAAWTGRSIDLSYGAAKALGIVAAGEAAVQIERLD